VGKARGNGSTIRNIVETRRMVTGEPRTSLVDVAPGGRAAPVVPAELAVWVALGVPVVPAELAVWVALVVPVGPVVLAVWVALGVPENPAVLVGLEDPGGPENRVALVVLESQGVPENRVVQELETGPVAVELALVQVEVRLRTKSGIAAHRHGQVRVPKKAEDLAEVAAVTMLAPAAAEAVTAWAAAE
jgi:hypothetical protein